MDSKGQSTMTSQDNGLSTKQLLSYRRQYVISNSEEFKPWEHWKSIRFQFSKIHISLHPDVISEYYANDQVEIALIGYILDPYEPTFSNVDILEALAKPQSDDDFIKATAPYGGRFLLVRQVKNGSSLVLGDTIASRELYYTHQDGKFWAAAQAHLLKKFIPLQERKDKAYLDFVNSKVYVNREKASVGDECVYENVYHLLPNFYINLSDKKAQRYWPRENFEPLSLKEGVEKAARLLTGLMQAANHRYALMIAFTAGWDSRMNVAATEAIHQDVQYYINLFPGLNQKHPDVFVPQKLSKKLGLNFGSRDHEKVEVDPEYLEIYHQNYQNPLDKFVKVYYHFFQNYEAHHINILTAGSEITRNYYPNYEPKSGDDVARMAGFRDFEFIQEQSANWLASMNQSNYSSPDIFYWEQRVGNWACHASTQPDMVRESLSLFNCRELLVTMLSVDRMHRGYSNKLYRRIMKKLWPEVLSEPINPPQNLKSQLKHYYRLAGLDERFKEIGVEKSVRRFYYKLRNRGWV